MSIETTNNRQLSWTVHPMKEKPLRAVLFWLALAIIIWAVYWNIITVFTPQSSLVFTFAAGIILLASLSSFYLPTRFTIDDSGAGYQRFGYRKLMAWEKIRSVTDEKFGLFVSPFPVKSRLENYRGLYLYYRDNHDVVIRAFQHYKQNLPGLPPIEPTEHDDDELICEDEGGW